MTVSGGRAHPACTDDFSVDFGHKRAVAWQGSKLFESRSALGVVVDDAARDFSLKTLGDGYRLIGEVFEQRAFALRDAPDAIVHMPIPACP
ncbi:hypothetical protein IV77_GL001640 [Olsenella uli DSM 7084]|uniref:hypothetical protein n=1 Tax=Slackia exigua TaxID=84109 RepID=UPI000714DFC6|nr:hypothetical protein [Slackia exigua]KRO12002.1 hypothetical protein IV77_GL001640 [Olsenella uli DSM 7084]